MASSSAHRMVPSMSHGPRHIKTYLDWIDKKKFLAPNLKELHLWKFAKTKGQGHPSNRVTFDIVKYHLLAFRWMNPNARVYLHEARVDETKPSYAEFTLFDGRKRQFTINHKQHTPEVVLAKIMFAARDPAFDPPEFKDKMAGKYEEERRKALEEEQQKEAEAYEVYQRAVEQPAEDLYRERISSHVPVDEDRQEFARGTIHPFSRSEKWIEYPEDIEDFAQQEPLWDTRPQSVKRQVKAREIEELMKQHSSSSSTDSNTTETYNDR